MKSGKAGIRWQVSLKVEMPIPTSIFINPRDCEGPSVDRKFEFMTIGQPANDDPWVEYHVGMCKLHIYTVAIAFNPYDNHGYRCNSWIHPDRRV